MRLFDDYEAVKFPEENLILITHNQYLYYIYNPKYKHWYRYKNAGNDKITVRNYPDISPEDLAAVTGGRLPGNEAEILMLLNPSELSLDDMIVILENDYPDYMSDFVINHPAGNLLSEADIRHKAYVELRTILDEARVNRQNHKLISDRVRELGMSITGRDVWSDSMRIEDGIGGEFAVKPARIVDYTNTDDRDNVAYMSRNAIGICEDDVLYYLYPFIDKYFDANLRANRRRRADPPDDFDWYGYNFFTFTSVESMLKDIQNTINDMASGKENEFTAQIRERGGYTTWETIPLEPPENGMSWKTEKVAVSSDRIIDFYQRFIYRMEYMIRVGKEKGYELICFQGP